MFSYIPILETEFNDESHLNFIKNTNIKTMIGYRKQSGGALAIVFIK